jgi:hypothetical protein
MKLNTEQLLEVISLSQEGKSGSEIGAKYGVNKSTINYFLARTTHSKFWAEYDSGNLETVHHLDDVIGDSPDKDLVKVSRQLRLQQRNNLMLRRQIRNGFDGQEYLEEILKGVKLATDNFDPSTSITPIYRPQTSSTPATLEILFSDLQIGKVSRYYNTEVARKAVREYCLGILNAITVRENVYNVERIVFAMVGDVVEDHLKHGVGSAISTDTGLAEQMQDAIDSIWTDLLLPLAQLDIPMDVVCITGNHGSSQHKGMDSFKAGRYSYDYVIHNTLERFCKLSKFNHVTFSIPDGTFGSIEIYGKTAIYEHGYHNPQSEKGMQDQMGKRGNQLRKHPTYWRQGDKHHTIQFQNSHLCCNGAFFGIEDEGIEYSGILGFNSDPTQTIMFHVDDNRRGKSNIKETINIQVHPS